MLTLLKKEIFILSKIESGETPKEKFIRKFDCAPDLMARVEVIQKMQVDLDLNDPEIQKRAFSVLPGMTKTVIDLQKMLASIVQK